MFLEFKGLPRPLLDALSVVSWEISKAEEEAKLFSVSADGGINKMSAGVSDASSSMKQALKYLGDRARCEPYLIEVKKKALEVERLHRRARADALEDVNVVSSIKRKEIYRHFSQAAEGLQKAADLMAGILAKMEEK